MDVAISWRQYQQAEADAKASGKPLDASHIPTSKLQEMLDKFRSKDGSKKD